MPLEKVGQDTELTTIFNKSLQTLAYPDGIDLISLTLRMAKQIFVKLESAATNMGKINTKKTKFMAATKKQREILVGILQLENKTTTNEVIYLEALMKLKNDKELKRRMMLADRCCFLDCQNILVIQDF